MDDYHVITTWVEVPGLGGWWLQFVHLLNEALHIKQGDEDCVISVNKICIGEGYKLLHDDVECSRYLVSNTMS